jgi:predicted  nucleic acid-binding Zn-ribbon protein
MASMRERVETYRELYDQQWLGAQIHMSETQVLKEENTELKLQKKKLESDAANLQRKLDGLKDAVKALAAGGEWLKQRANKAEEELDAAKVAADNESRSVLGVRCCS